MNTFKDSIPKYLCSNLIYKFLCSFCKATYCETKRNFFVRASGHLEILPLTHKPVKNSKTPAIMDHILLECPNPTYDDFFKSHARIQ